MNINIPNSVIWANAYKVILAIAILIACFTNDAAYNIGRLFTISLMSVGTAHFLFKKKTEYGQSIAKALAALIPVFVAISFITSDKSRTESMDSIRQSVTEMKFTYEKALDGNTSGANSNLDKPTLNQFKDFKAAKTREELLREAARLVKLASQQNNFVLASQEKNIADIKLFDNMSVEKLININAAQNLKNSAEKYGAFIAKMKSDSAEFNAQYKATFYLVSANFPAEIAGFDETFAVSTKDVNDMYTAQSELAVEIAKIGTILITAYKNQQVRYDPSIKNLSFLNDGLMNSYNQALDKIEVIAAKEEEITQRYLKNLSKIQNINPGNK